MEALAIFGLCILILIVCRLYCAYKDKHEFYVCPNTVVLLSVNHLLSDKKIYTHSSQSYKKLPNENVNVFHIETKNNTINASVLTSDKTKNVLVQIEYDSTYDLTHLIDTVNDYGLSSYNIQTKLDEYIRSIVQFVMLQNEYSIFYDYTKIDKCIEDIQFRLDTYLLKKHMYIDVKIRSLKLLQTTY